VRKPQHPVPTGCRVLGLDPGYGRLGYAVVEEKGSALKALDFGVMETPSTMPFEQRLLKVFDFVEALVGRHACDEAAVETLYFSKNVKTAIGVAEARGVIRLALVRLGLPVVEIKPMELKLAVTGSGRADKVQVTRMVTRLLNLPAPPKPDDAADALGLAITALRGRAMRKLMALAKASR
jgi:crossover junction endodeoxyribonuclease RuvC